MCLAAALVLSNRVPNVTAEYVRLLRHTRAVTYSTSWMSSFETRINRMHNMIESGRSLFEKVAVDGI